MQEVTMRAFIALLLCVTPILGGVTLGPTSCAQSKTYNTTIPTISSITTLYIDSQVSDLDQIVMLPPAIGQSILVSTVAYSDSASDVNGVTFESSTSLTTYFYTIKSTSSSTSSGSSSSGTTSTNPTGSSTSPGSTGSPTGPSSTGSSSSGQSSTGPSSSSTSTSTPSSGNISGSHKLSTGFVSVVMSVVFGLAVMLRVRPSLLILCIMVWLCMGVWAACSARVVVYVSAPSTVHTVCFKGVCYCNCVTKGCGVNVHFTETTPAVLKNLKDLNVGTVRVDFNWEGVEYNKGNYEYGQYDFLAANLTTFDITPYYILDYGNHNYENGISPADDYTRNAFANFAGNATLHLQGKNIIWEMWNEPNLAFWKPTPNVTQYIELAKATGERVKSVTPGEVFVGPTVTPDDHAYLSACLSSGLLEYFDAVSLHPYRGGAPEAAYSEYVYVRSLIRQYKPASKPFISPLSGEWGYTTVDQSVNDPRKVTEEQQAQFIVRMYMTNLMNEVPVSIWYDFVDDGDNSTNSEDRFGLYRDFGGTNGEAYELKPSGQAAVTFFSLIRNLSFNKRLDTGDSTVYVTLWSDGDLPSTVVVIAWTTGVTQTIKIPASAGTFGSTNLYGNSTSTLTAAGGFLSVSISQSPVYLVPKARNDFLWFMAGIKRLPIEIVGYGNSSINIVVPNSFSTTQTVTIGSDTTQIAPGQVAFFSEPIFLDIQNVNAETFSYTISVTGVGSFNLSTFSVSDYAIVASATYPSSSNLAFQIYNPTGLAFSGTLEVTISGKTISSAISIAAGIYYKTINFALGTNFLNISTVYHVDYEILDSKNVLAGYASNDYKTIDDFSKYTTATIPNYFLNLTYGDTNAYITYSLAIANPPAGPPSAGVSCMKVQYTISTGHRYLVIAPKTGQPVIPFNFTQVGMWIYGDASGNIVRTLISDSESQTFQITFSPVTWTGWQYMTAPAQNNNYYGGPDDGILRYPARFTNFFLLDTPILTGSSGTIYFTPPVAVL